MKWRGFTLPEILIVMAIMVIIAGFGLANYFGYRSKVALDSATEIIVRELNSTRARAIAQEGGYQWWMRFDNPAGAGNDLYVVCYGTTYAGSGANCTAEGGNESKRYPLSSGLEFTNPASIPKDAAFASKDVIFSKAVGSPVDVAGLPVTTVVTINSRVGAGSKTITINPNGSIAY